MNQTQAPNISQFHCPIIYHGMPGNPIASLHMHYIPTLIDIHHKASMMDTLCLHHGAHSIAPSNAKAVKSIAPVAVADSQKQFQQESSIDLICRTYLSHQGDLGFAVLSHKYSMSTELTNHVTAAVSTIKVHSLTQGKQ